MRTPSLAQLVLAVFLSAAAIGAAHAADIFVTEWKTNETGEIDIKNAAGEKTAIKAPTIPPGGVKATMTPSGNWEAMIDGQRIQFRMQVAKTYTSGSASTCITDSGRPYSGKQVSGLNGCDLGK